MRLRKLLAATMTACLLATLIPVMSVSADTNDVSIPINEETFPDSAFRQWVLDKVDIFHDKTITQSDIEYARSFKCIDKGIESIEGIENFKYLTYLDISGNDISYINSEWIKGLETLTCDDNKITSLDVSSLENLRYLSCANNEMTSLAAPVTIKYLNVGGNCLSIDLSDYPCLLSLDVRESNLTTIDLSGASELTSLDIRDNSITSLDLSTLPKLQYLYVMNNRLSELDLSNNSEMVDLYCSGNNISEINVTGIDMFENLFSDYSLTVKDLKYAHDHYYMIGDFDFDSYVEEAYFLGENHLNALCCDLFTRVICGDNVYVAVEDAKRPDWAVTESEVTPVPEVTPEVTPAVTPKATPTSVPTATPVPVATTEPTTVPNESTPVEPTATSKPTPTVTPTSAPIETRPTAVPTATPTVPATTTAPTSIPTTAPTKVPVSGSDNAVVTPVADPSTETSASKEQGVAGFVERLYTVALNRDSDKEGKAYWINEVMNEGKTGADIARFFLCSEEFLSMNKTDSEFLDVLYKTFFDREADSDGKAFWAGKMSEGMTKLQVIDGFINSEEWANLCLTYGIRSGSAVAPTIVITPNEQVKGFAERLYTKCLGRESDVEGLAYWANELANLRKTGSEVAAGFFFSDEMTGFELSDADYLERLYVTMMDRASDKSGFDYWMNQMAGGMDRRSVFEGFVNSPEWAGICANYGILK